MTKDELIARLRSLGEQLNRDVSLTGTKEELALRVAELEEELDDTDDAAGQDTSVSPENALTGHENEVYQHSGYRDDTAVWSRLWHW
ncbi:DNA packaging FI family protein [Escherichia coli BCE034_MS-14]|nr:DNA packaging FI family protein [Escherichia coli BCE034_MS-14]